MLGWQASSSVVLPSLLLCDFGNLEREVRRLEAADAAGLHLDVMDGRFVPNLTYGLPIVQAFRSLTDLPLDVHLMIENPGQFIEAFYQAGADVITVHQEAVDDARPLLEQIRKLGALAGLAINPATPTSAINDCLGLCDVGLVMSVQPGFGGQPFNEVALEKLGELNCHADRPMFLEVDGGVDEQTARSCAEAGAQLLVVGSAIFRSDDYTKSLATLTELTRSVGNE